MAPNAFGAGEANSWALFNEPATRRGAGAAPTRRAARILAGCPASVGLLVSQRPQRVFSFLAPRSQPKFAAPKAFGAIPASDLVH